jgi:hypothetical protein
MPIAPDLLAGEQEFLLVDGWSSKAISSLEQTWIILLPERQSLEQKRVQETPRFGQKTLKQTGKWLNFASKREPLVEVHMGGS